MTVSSTSATFVDRHIGARRQADIDIMLKAVGYDSVDSLVDTAVPNDIRQDVALTLQNALSEVEVLAELRRQTGLPWRVLNLSVSGSLTRDVLGAQLPVMPAHADLVTCGIGINDILYTSPAKLFADLRALIAAVPDRTVLLDLPLPAGCWGFLGRASVPYVTRINRTIHQAAAARGLPVAEVSATFLPPWPGKFASDYFHPSQHGYRDWSRALLNAVTSLAATA